MIRQNPFSIYDFLGYLIPGSLVIYAYLAIDYLNNSPDFEIEEFISTFSNFKFEGMFFFIIISYTIGHLVSFTSSITVERYAIWRYSYPSKYLLSFDHNGFWGEKLRWKIIFKRTKWNDIFKSVKFFLKRIVIITVLFPCVFFDWVLGQFFDFKQFYTRPLDHLLRDVIKAKTALLFEEVIPDDKLKEQYKTEKVTKHDFHRIISHYAYEHSKNHQAKMSNYVALYGFLRTLCFILNVLALYFGVRVLFFEFVWFDLYAFLSFSLASYLSFMAFMKFYRRYTLEGFMVVVVNELPARADCNRCAAKQKRN